MLYVAVEGGFDKLIVEMMLRRAGIGSTTILVMHGQLKRTNLVSSVSERPLIAVFDQDSGSVADAVTTNEPGGTLVMCPAIPTVDAWLFADFETLREVIGDRTDSLIGRMPLPEQIPYPKFLRHALLRDEAKAKHLLERVNLIRAGSRSPSLKYFLQSARRLSGLPPLGFDTRSATDGQLDRSLLRNLVSEVYPSAAPLFRTATGVVLTGEQMMQEIINGSEIGREYGSDILRVARDLLARQARNKARESDS